MVLLCLKMAFQVFNIFQKAVALFGIGFNAALVLDCNSLSPNFISLYLFFMVQYSKSLLVYILHNSKVFLQCDYMSKKVVSMYFKVL